MIRFYKHILQFSTIFFLSILVFIPCHAATPGVRVLDSKKITSTMLTTRTKRKEILVERQISRITSIKDGGHGRIINDKKASTTYYYGQIPHLKKGYYVTTYYFYNPYSNGIDDVIWWYSFVTKTAHGSSLKVLSPSQLTRKKLKNRSKDHIIYIKNTKSKSPKRSVTLTLYNPENSNPKDIVDSWTFAY